MNKIRPEQKTLILAILLLSLVIAGVGGNVYLFLQVQESSNRLAGIKRNLSLTAQKEKEVSIWYSRSSQLIEEFELLKASFINPELPVEFVEEMEKIAEESGVDAEIAFLAREAGRGGEKVRPLSVRITVRGDFIPCLRFLDKLEHVHYLVRVEGLSISTYQESVQFTILTEVLSYAVQD